MTDFAQYADPQLLDDPRTTLLVLRAAEFSDDAEPLDGLARSGVTSEVLRKIARNPATAEHTLEYLIDVDERGLTFPVTSRTDVSEDFIDRIARRLTDRTAIFQVSSAPPRPPRRRYATSLIASMPLYRLPRWFLNGSGRRP